MSVTPTEVSANEAQRNKVTPQLKRHSDRSVSECNEVTPQLTRHFDRSVSECNEVTRSGETTRINANHYGYRFGITSL